MRRAVLCAAVAAVLVPAGAGAQSPPLSEADARVTNTAMKTLIQWSIDDHWMVMALSVVLLLGGLWTGTCAETVSG